MAILTPSEPRVLPCPDPLTRAPRAADGARPPVDRLLQPPAALQGAIAAIICRDTRHCALTDAQRLSHFPASPLLCLSWYASAAYGLVERSGDGAGRWHAFDATVMVSGSQSEPRVSWSPEPGRGGMLCFTVDVARSLFGLDPAAVHDRFVPADEVLAARWTPLQAALLAADHDGAVLAALHQHLAPHWQALRGREGDKPSLRQLGRHWVDRLAWQAHEWQRTHSPRQVERRIKAYSGRSLRDWQTLVRTEGLFFAARDRHDAGEAYDWAGLAAEHGFADQAHMIRAARRITGFSPGEFAERFAEDESFWLYRLWV